MYAIDAGRNILNLIGDRNTDRAGNRAADHRTAVLIAEAALALRAGKLVAFPTETVYGLGGAATDDRAVAAIFEAKGRPSFNPLIIHVADREQASSIAAWDRLADQLAARFWPGPLTLVLRRHAGCPVSMLASAGGDTIAIRAPAHPMAQALLRETALPVAAPSANTSGRVSPTTAAHVVDDLGDRVDLVVDGGPCAVGLESTVLDLTGPRPTMLRPGGLPREDIEAVIGELAVSNGTPDPAGEKLRSPGQLRSHYAPRHEVRLDAAGVDPGEALLAFGPHPLTGAAVTANLSVRGDLQEAAANLFSMLHHLDRQDVSKIAVMPVPGDGLGEAIRDRLARAAAGS